jgi:hypothetical protein
MIITPNIASGKIAVLHPFVPYELCDFIPQTTSKISEIMQQ